MQAQQIGNNNDVAKRSHKGLHRTLLIGSEEVFNNEATHRVLFRGQFRVAGQSTTLLDGLSRLESEAIDLVLLSREFRDEELSLFAYDAHRRGYFGPILHVASVPGETARATHASNGEVTDGRFGQAGWKVESNEVSEDRFSQLHPVHTKPPTTRVQANPMFIAPPGSIVLTARQETVMTQVSDGRSNQEIARELNCSEGSVKAVLQQLFAKFGVRKRVQIVRMAIERAPIEPQIVRPVTFARSLGRHIETRQGTIPAGKCETDAEDTTCIEVGDFVIDVSGHRVWIRGTEVQLTRQELKLLTLLSRHPQKLLSHDDLVGALWNKQPASRESLRVLIQAVRKKIEPTTPPRYIVTMPYHGYRFVPSP
jgi:DNA-binding winged helix-turn-helix (wHTH) protein/DNA-binding CsgD family transcriptional regulator